MKYIQSMDKKSSKDELLAKLMHDYTRLIPDVETGKLSYDVRSEAQDNLNDKGKVREFEKRSKQIEQLLEKYGFLETDISIICDRLLSNMTLEEISEKYSYKNRHYVNRLIKALVERLKQDSDLKEELKDLLFRNGNMYE